MSHIHEDNLLAYALQVLDTEIEREEIITHLESCEECRTSLSQIRDDIAIIGGVTPHSQVLPLPRSPQRQFTYRLLRAAALILLGVAIGYGVSSREQAETQHVGPAYVQTGTPAGSSVGIAVSDATEIPVQTSP